MASLTKRQGVLGKRLAAHLLRRTTFQVTPARIADFATKTAEQAVNELFIVPALTHPKGPINSDDMTTYWLTDGPYTPPSDFNVAKRSVMLWFHIELMKDTSIRHKMALFLKTIYVSGSDEDWRLFDAMRLFQFYALGNLKTLAKKITLDNRMLRFLNNNTNNKWNPNENYAREFFELFTILKGTQVGTDDYTNYTEADISEAAKVLTGYYDGSQTDIDPDTGLTTGTKSYYWHHPGNKQFSHRFDHKVILGATSEADMDRELDDFVSMIFDKVETARAYVRRLYLFFVAENITVEIEQDIIEPLALQLWTDNYEVVDVLKKLLKSVHFYDEDDSNNTDEIIGGKIKSPLELYFTSIAFFDADKSGGLNSQASNFNPGAKNVLRKILEYAGMHEFPLTVEGYPGFFKNPVYSKAWADSSTLPMRYNLKNALLEGRTLDSYYNHLPYYVSTVDFFKNNFTNQDYADQFLTQIFEVVFSEMPDATRTTYFKNKLIGGVTDVNWMFEWQNYLATNDDAAVKVVLEDLLKAIIGSPEYQVF